MKRRDLIVVIERIHDAAQIVLDNWSEGDLAGAVNGLEEAMEGTDAALTWWKADQADAANNEIDRLNAQADRINREDAR